MIVATTYMVIAWVIVPFIEAARGHTFEETEMIQVEPKRSTRTNIEEEVTVGDMVLHDMMNQDDTYDIGTIDFGD